MCISHFHWCSLSRLHWSHVPQQSCTVPCSCWKTPRIAIENLCSTGRSKKASSQIDITWHWLSISSKLANKSQLQNGARPKGPSRVAGARNSNEVDRFANNRLARSCGKQKPKRKTHTNTKNDETVKHPADSMRNGTHIISREQRFKIRVLEVSYTCSSKVFTTTSFDTWHVCILTLDNLWFFPGVFQGSSGVWSWCSNDRMIDSVHRFGAGTWNLRHRGETNLSGSACKGERISGRLHIGNN